MSAKRPGTLPVIFVAYELQRPLPRKIMLCESDMSSTGGRNGVSPKKLRASAIDSTLCKGGRGLTIVISAPKIGWGWKIPSTAWVFQGLLADIVAGILRSILLHFFYFRSGLRTFVAERAMKVSCF